MSHVGVEHVRPSPLRKQRVLVKRRIYPVSKVTLCAAQYISRGVRQCGGKPPFPVRG